MELVVSDASVKRFLLGRVSQKPGRVNGPRTSPSLRFARPSQRLGL